MTFRYKIHREEFAGDMHTPVSIYLKVRDIFPQSVLLESSDYHSAENSRSYIALDPIANITVNNGEAQFKYNDSIKKSARITPEFGVDKAIELFMSHFSIEGEYGLFGYTAYDSVKYFENIAVVPQLQKENDAPDVQYILFRYTLIFDHFHNKLTLLELIEDNKESNSGKIRSAINNRNYAAYGFNTTGSIHSPIDDERYRNMVREGIRHCLRGDVFQIVLSRRFIQPFIGDDFTVYRALRSVNPSPYLFYFDFGGFRIFGSSPETHCKIYDNRITIDPIAGTAFRSGDSKEDKSRAGALLKDPKENSEHVMLVDLARNDLSRNAENVKVDLYKEIQYYSHVIHLVSRVSGNLANNISNAKAYIDTFPAGTLSGAPKVRAMQLINEIEPHNRGIYGGAIGYIGFDGSLNQAITIRTFVSRNGNLEFQAGAGIVALSNPERELQEVNNKLGALSKAINLAKTIEL